jgi:molybdopterin-guanine dinucleotide biosynthesis protein A
VLTGTILAGGKSVRYGRNKALEVFHGERLIDRAVESLRPFCDPILVVCNDLSLYHDVRATLVQDIIPQQGPLVGIYTALLFSPNDWILTRATDMPFLAPELLRMMLELKEGFDVVVPLYKDWYEPLFALYHRRCIPSIATHVEAGERQAISFYGKVKVKAMEEKVWRGADPEGLSFRNINTPEDWEGLEWS